MQFHQHQIRQAGLMPPASLPKLLKPILAVLNRTGNTRLGGAQHVRSSSQAPHSCAVQEKKIQFKNSDGIMQDSDS